jgi:Family of unknown function (DUF6308)
MFARHRLFGFCAVIGDAVCIKIPGPLLDVNYAARLVREYLAEDGGRFRYSGAYFERLGGGGDRPEVAYQVTAEDLLAVSMLSVRVIRYYALDVLVYQARDVSDLLAQIPVDVALADAGAEELIADGGPASRLWTLLHDIKPPLERSRLGPVAAGKLLARKRPQLIPVYDSYVKKALDRPRVDETFWRDLRCQLTRDTSLVSELEAVRARVGEPAAHLSVLRVFDIMCWMHEGRQQADWAQSWPPGPEA